MRPETRALAWKVGDLIRDASTRHGAILDADVEGEPARELAVDASWLRSVAGQLHDAAGELEEALREDASSATAEEALANVPHLLDERPDDYEVSVELGADPGLPPVGRWMCDGAHALHRHRYGQIVASVLRHTSGLWRWRATSSGGAVTLCAPPTHQTAESAQADCDAWLLEAGEWILDPQTLPHQLDCAPFEDSTVEPLDAVLAEEIDSPYFWPPPAGGGR